jgi:N-ethylmaleimide reductase
VAHPDFGQHPCNQTLKYQPGVSASPTQIVDRHGKPGKTVTYQGEVKEYSVPRELSIDDIIRLRQDYIQAAENAKQAGFDGIEIHAAHGYLIDQLLNDGVNRRTDAYGGTVANRCRLLVEVVESVLQVWPEGKVGVRLSPHDSPNGGATYYGCKDSNPDAVYSEAITRLNKYPLAYLLMTEPRWVGRHDGSPETDPGFQIPLINLQKYRSLFDGVLIGAGGFTPSTSYHESCSTTKGRGYDALGFGRWFISNPDLPERLRAHHVYESQNRPVDVKPPSLNRYDRNTFYSQGAEGYIDYPSMEYDQAVALKCSDAGRVEFEGMISGKYELMDAALVGTSLMAAETKVPSSRL